MSDLAAATVTGGRTARDRLVQAFLEARGDLVSTLFCLLGNYEDAQDATQEAFVKCWRARAGAGRIHNFRAWVFRVGLNAARDLRRNAWRRRARPLGKAPACPDPAACPEDAAMARENLDRLRRALRGLRGTEREVFLLRQNGDLTYEEIAVVCRRPVGTVKTQMRAALQKLRRTLNEAPTV
jgi:RNA polymerase sigma-70 factor (ECF subfamily)